MLNAIYSAISETFGVVLEKCGLRSRSRAEAIDHFLQSRFNPYGCMVFDADLNFMIAVVRSLDPLVTSESCDSGDLLEALSMSAGMRMQYMLPQAEFEKEARGVWAGITADFDFAAVRWSIENAALKPNDVWYGVARGDARLAVICDDCVRLFGVDPFAISVYSQAEKLQIKSALNEWLDRFQQQALLASFNPVRFYKQNELFMEVSGRVVAGVFLLLNETPERKLRSRLDPVMTALQGLSQGQLLGFVAANLRAYELLDAAPESPGRERGMYYKDTWDSLNRMRLKGTIDLLTEYLNPRENEQRG